MQYETVRRQKAFALDPNEPEYRRLRAALAQRYDLAAALRIVRAMETSATRGAVFAEITSKNPLYRLVDVLYRRAGARFVQPLALLAYMLKCVLSPGPLGRDDGAEAVSIINFANERHTIDRLAALVPDVRVLRLALGRRHFLGRGQLRAALSLVGAAPRIWPFLSRLSRSCSFMPSARIASGLAYYMRFSRLFASRPGLGAAIVASNYSPEALGLAAAAHRSGRQVIYVNHAPVPANAPLVPPVLADLAVFYGEETRRTYERRSRCAARVALIGQPGRARPMEWRGEVRKVGIFLTALTRAETVAGLVSAIAAGNPGLQVLIRNHPVALLKSGFADLAARHPNLEVTIGNPLDDEAAACDMVFCGNSGVVMNVLRAGRPVAYLGALDALPFDYIGFVASGLVCETDGWSEELYGRMRMFYARPEWRGIMRGYDASYGADGEALEREAAGAIRRHVNPRPDRGSAGFRALWPARPSFREAI